MQGFLPAADCLATLACLRCLGVGWALEEKRDGGSDLAIEGRGLDGLRESGDVLDAANSGTTLRLLAGLLAGRPFLSILTGDESLRSRPMARVVEPLRQMGAQVWGREGDSRAPLVIRGGRLSGIRYHSPVASAQVKSAVLLAGLQAEEETLFAEPAQSRDHMERLLRAMGADLKEEGGMLRLRPLQCDLTPLDLAIPGDFSAAAFWLVAAALHPNAEVTLRATGVNPTRTGLLDVLREMGAEIAAENERMEGGEPVAELRARSGRLRGAKVGGETVVRLIDEVPLLAVAASLAEGRTELRDLGELRVKESDRVGLTVLELRRLGASIEEEGDGLIIEGKERLSCATVDSHGDHRLAMALAVAGLVAEGETVIENAEATEVSYPGFWRDLEALSQP